MTDTDDTKGPWVQGAGRMLRRRAELEALEAVLAERGITKAQDVDPKKVAELYMTGWEKTDD